MLKRLEKGSDYLSIKASGPTCRTGTGSCFETEVVGE